ncbi:MAG: hypothetical protein KJ587_15075 [Alphaproteobacteria bacterium]|nr:hypothetical protein [Alphaproteobacteria bacterium]
MKLSEANPIFTSEQLRDAREWLANRPVGATLVEFLQKLPVEQAEVLLVNAQEIKRLTAEEERSEAAAKQITERGAMIGLGALAAISILGGGIFPPFVLIATCGSVGAVTWWFTRSARNREWARQWDAWHRRDALRSEIRKRLGVAYYEKDERVHSLHAIKKQHDELTNALATNDKAFAEIQQGIEKGREAGIDSSLLRKAQEITRVIGGLPTEELVEHPDTELLHRAMCQAGLHHFTIESILHQYGDELPVSPRTRAVLASRIAPAN